MDLLDTDQGSFGNSDTDPDPRELKLPQIINVIKKLNFLKGIGSISMGLNAFIEP